MKNSFDGQWADTLRPASIDDFIASNKVKLTVKSILQAKRPPNTILLTGPTGTGKTTLARIIAANIGGIGDKYEKFDHSKERFQFPSDIAEANCGDDTGIENARELIKAAAFKPRSLKRRVFILDEVHALTAKAMSSLLKPLEEPSKTTSWIICTNYPEKLKAEIIGRAVHIHLPELSEDQSLNLLASIAKQAKSAGALDVPSKIVKEVAEIVLTQNTSRFPRKLISDFQRNILVVQSANSEKETKAILKELKKSSFSSESEGVDDFLDTLDRDFKSNVKILMEQAFQVEAFPELFNAVRRRMATGKFEPVIARMFAWCIDANGWAVHNGMRPLEYVAARYAEYYVGDKK